MLLVGIAAFILSARVAADVLDNETLLRSVTYCIAFKLSGLKHCGGPKRKQ
jgi:hypothetical protein